MKWNSEILSPFPLLSLSFSFVIFSPLYTIYFSFTIPPPLCFSFLRSSCLPLLSLPFFPPSLTSTFLIFFHRLLLSPHLFTFLFPLSSLSSFLLHPPPLLSFPSIPISLRPSPLQSSSSSSSSSTLSSYSLPHSPCYPSLSTKSSIDVGKRGQLIPPHEKAY